MSFSRRKVIALSGGFGFGLGGGLLLPPAAAATRAIPFDLSQGSERIRLRAKIAGRLDPGTVHRYVRLHIYGYANDGNLVPFFSMMNYSANQWRQLPNGNYETLVYESGVYTKFDSDEVLTEWENPLTKEKREVWQFRAGPLRVETGPDGLIAGPETTVKPKPMAIETIEDTLYFSTGSAFRFPSPFQPDEFPKESPGKMYFWDSHSVNTANLNQLADPALMSAPSEMMLTNLVSWAPWMGMGQLPGRTYGRGFGRKLSGLDQLPAKVRTATEKYIPEVFDLANWTKPYDDIAAYKDYLKSKKATP